MVVVRWIYSNGIGQDDQGGRQGRVAKKWVVEGSVTWWQ